MWSVDGMGCVLICQMLIVPWTLVFLTIKSIALYDVCAIIFDLLLQGSLRTEL